jgi:hypothetical protein
MRHGGMTIATGVKRIALFDLRRPNHGCVSITSSAKEMLLPILNFRRLRDAGKIMPEK